MVPAGRSRSASSLSAKTVRDVHSLYIPTTHIFAESGIILEAESTLVDAQGTPYARLYSGSFNLGAKATGTNFSKRIAGPPQGKTPPKDRKPDWVVRDQTTPEQAVIYRLSGDYNELHISASYILSHVPLTQLNERIPLIACRPGNW